MKSKLALVLRNLLLALEYIDSSDWSVINECVSILKLMELMATELSGKNMLLFVISFFRRLQYGINI